VVEPTLEGARTGRAKRELPPGAADGPSYRRGTHPAVRSAAAARAERPRSWRRRYGAPCPHRGAGSASPSLPRGRPPAGWWIWYRSIASTPSRVRLASHSRRSDSADSSLRTTPPSQHTREHFVNTIGRSLGGSCAVARPTSSSERPSPYVGAVSTQFTPCATAHLMAWIGSRSSCRPHSSPPAAHAPNADHGDLRAKPPEPPEPHSTAPIVSPRTRCRCVPGPCVAIMKPPRAHIGLLLEVSARAPIPRSSLRYAPNELCFAGAAGAGTARRALAGSGAEGGTIEWIEHKHQRPLGAGA
jgi:hypothetical protein